jgi:hypothetical protein
MKCEKCGSEISINDKYCPNCGARNAVGASHVDDMRRFEHTFKSTETDVRNRSGWFIKYITPMVVLVTSVVIFVVLLFISHDSGYSIARRKQDSYNKNHADEITEKIMELAEDEEYLQTYMLYYVADQQPKDTEHEYYNGWNWYYEAVDNYYSVRDSITAHYSAEGTDSGNSDLSKAATNIYNFYDNISERNLARSLPESVVYIEKIRGELEQFLAAYCNFSDEDIESLPTKDTTGIISLMTRRMIDEE